MATCILLYPCQMAGCIWIIGHQTHKSQTTQDMKKCGRIYGIKGKSNSILRALVKKLKHSLQRNI